MMVKQALLFISLCLCFCLAQSYTKSTFIGAVYEHAVILPHPLKVVTRQEALHLMNQNLDIYREQAEMAHKENVDLLVFPEDGIYGFLRSRDSLFPYLEAIPDPQNVTWSPCIDPKRFPNSEVQYALSCMAKEFSLYIVANMGDKVACDRSLDPKCPEDGRYQYNTDVAFGPDGTLLAKYHKRHLFFEVQFDTPPAQVRYFNTPFGRFGMLVCFDLLFHDPAVTMVKEHKIANIVFPTAWMDALPLLSALGYHSSFSRGLGLNFLAANLHIPTKRFHGSGLYAPDGMKQFYYSNDATSLPRLLVSEFEVLNEPKMALPEQDKLDSRNNDERSCVTPEDRNGVLKKHSSDLDNNKNDEVFKATLFHDVFTFKALEETSGTINVCDNGVCCYLDYTYLHHPGNKAEHSQNSDDNNDLLALGVFDGLHTYEGQYYFQICALVRCADPNNRSSCGSPTLESFSSFVKLRLRGTFQTSFIYPQLLLTNQQQLQLAPSNSWSFENNTLTVVEGELATPLLSAALLGRDYGRDSCPHSLSTSNMSESYSRDNSNGASIEKCKYLLLALSIVLNSGITTIVYFILG